MKEDIFISNGSRPLWQTIIAAVLYTAAFYFVYLFFINFDVDASAKSAASPLQAAVILFSIAIRFSLVIDYQFDIGKKRYKKIYAFGFIQYGKWQPFKKLQYVAVYTNQREEIELNLWYNKNKHFTLSYFEDQATSIEVARSIAKKLNIDFWNAIDPRNGYWE